MENNALNVLREHLGEEKSLLDFKMMKFLVEGFVNEDSNTIYDYALYTNLLIEFKKCSDIKYQELQYHITSGEEPNKICIGILNKMIYKTNEMVRIEELLKCSIIKC